MFRLPWRLYQQCGFSSFFSSCLSRTLRHLVCRKLAFLYHSLSILIILLPTRCPLIGSPKLSKEANSNLLSVSIWSRKVLNVAARNWEELSELSIGGARGSPFSWSVFKCIQYIVSIYYSIFNVAFCRHFWIAGLLRCKGLYRCNYDMFMYTSALPFVHHLSIHPCGLPNFSWWMRMVHAHSQRLVSLEVKLASYINISSDKSKDHTS